MVGPSGSGAGPVLSARGQLQLTVSWPAGGRASFAPGNFTVHARTESRSNALNAAPLRRVGMVWVVRGRTERDLGADRLGGGDCAFDGELVVSTVVPAHRIMWLGLNHSHGACAADRSVSTAAAVAAVAAGGSHRRYGWMCQ